MRVEEVRARRLQGGEVGERFRGWAVPERAVVVRHPKDQGQGALAGGPQDGIPRCAVRL